MKIEPINLAEFDLVELMTANDCRPTPHCKNHGAMNKITLDANGGGFWRCIAITGYKKVVNGNSVALVHCETICRAGCNEIATPRQG